MTCLPMLRYSLLLILLCCASSGYAADEFSDRLAPRGRLDHSRERFERDAKGHVAFLGGSITEMNGYRPLVMQWLQERFPETDFAFTNAGIASTCSTTGAFRLTEDVLEQGPLDLLFVEFAVNDDQDAAHTRRECIQGLEGIIRQARRHNSDCDIVVTYFVNPGMLEALQEGKTPLPIAAHETVCEHYNVPSVHLAGEVADRISAGTFSWKEYGGTHPALPGNQLCASMIAELLSSAWTSPPGSGAKPQPHSLPEPLDAAAYDRGRFVDHSEATLVEGWSRETPDWSAIPGNCRTRYRDLELLTASQPGATLKLSFRGRAVGAFVLAGPDAGNLQASIDGGPWQSITLYHRYSENLHYPRTVMFADDLDEGPHELELRVARDHHPDSQGTAVRIIRLVVNGAAARP
ncbi:hypothetical protein Mal4_10540 [Maioricimonas rarisocia]|uniref:SGNH hydrolase-type esterase domain-containing protein n=1 Tax=Maioricimonas rarisocia TaxID=2528026 RepID=A0A517Z2Q5_9PLAN|nr:SGNH/GDSL hydrolase family protein [Maioricimonas rarisocia]QDU36756.1 hypothetical protein Mal4_10540 [Maioricimonas rarisocia]